MPQSSTLEFLHALEESLARSGQALDPSVMTTEQARAVLRGYGVRRENVRLNTGRRLYAFNWLQQTMLPEPYRPPDGSAKGGKS